jgi:hypothetical protein
VKGTLVIGCWGATNFYPTLKVEPTMFESVIEAIRWEPITAVAGFLKPVRD